MKSKEGLLTTHLYIEQWGPGWLWLGPKDGRLCCLGHDAVDRGVPLALLDNQSMPSDLPQREHRKCVTGRAPADFRNRVLRLTKLGKTKHQNVATFLALLNDWCFEGEGRAAIGRLNSERAEMAMPLLREGFRLAGRRLVVHKTGKRELR